MSIKCINFPNLQTILVDVILVAINLKIINHKMEEDIYESYRYCKKNR